jgi:divalent metal cation (Fe/Co/Zn/Cd) transporter
LKGFPRQTASTAIKADALHYVSGVASVASNLGTIAALALVPLGWTQLDPFFGIVIALITLAESYGRDLRTDGPLASRHGLSSTAL